jgi:hypothetical protein
MEAELCGGYFGGYFVLDRGVLFQTGVFWR